MSYKKWNIAEADKDKASALSEKFNIDPFVSYLLVARGIDDELEVSDFLSKSAKLSDPFEILDMDKAVNRIETAIDYGEKITVYGDYDCDGVTSTALLYSLFRDMGADVDCYIPSRETEGYGLNKDAVKKLSENGTKLIVTVDNGISAVEEAEYIYSLGMELVVTDHHSVPDVLPRAEAVVNPHRQDGELPFTDFAGVGVAFKLACALYGDSDDMLERFADLAALGTIADVMPLTDENRCIVRAGLRLINSGARIGINALKEVAGCGEKIISSVDAAFTICPRINATGRIDSAFKAFELLVCEDEDEAAEKAQELNANNTRRQKFENDIFEDVMRRISEKPSLSADRVIVIDGEGYHQGVVGIVAARVLEHFSKPVIIIGVDENGIGRGSARSVDGFNINSAIAYCSELLTHFGGHPKAAGLSLEADKIEEFRKLINQYAAENYPIMPSQCVDIDIKISPFYLNLELAHSLSVLEPYGEGNKRAVFALMGLTVSSVNPMGNGKHIRIECEKKGRKIRIVKFSTPPEKFPFAVGDVIDAAVKISVNPYNGREYLSVQAVDIRKHGVDENKYFFEKEEYELFNLDKNNSPNVYPNRGVCAEVYKQIKKRKNRFTQSDDLYFDLNGVTYGQMMFSIKAFLQSGLITYDDGAIVLSQIENKVKLEETKIIQYLKGRLNLE
ncbi:MAG: single-stranded-DNA-specific exonuclease RecJ [Eubacterium sp.]